MDFKIGQDMGVVLAKGVFMSLVCIFTLLPGVVVTFDKIIEKSRKKSLEIPMTGVMKLVTKLGAVVLPAVLIIVGLAYVRKDDVKVGFLKVFDNSDQTYIEDCFGYDNQTVLLYRNTESPETVADYIEWLGKRDDVNSVQDYSNTLGVSCTPAEIAAQFGFEESQAQMLFRMSGKETMTTAEFLSAASAMLEQMPDSDDKLAQLKAAQKLIGENTSQMLGSEYNRMVVSLRHESEGDKSFSAIGELIDEADERFEGTHYFVGDSVMGKEMNDGFKKELNFVTMLTVFAIFIVVIITFRAIFSSAILVAVIQSSVFITTLIMVLSGFTVNYIALILVQCILMGATIDYGILFTCNYIEERRTSDKKQALGSAMDRSVKTILTSSLILIGCCLTTGLLMTQKAISQTCSMIACGTAVSVVMVVFVLPLVIYLTDKLAIMQFGRKK
jgi:predicted RND superfamily exporter protein